MWVTSRPKGLTGECGHGPATKLVPATQLHVTLHTASTFVPWQQRGISMDTAADETQEQEMAKEEGKMMRATTGR
jgi:hypothetical protein